jgi:hypothetical protein
MQATSWVLVVYFLSGLSLDQGGWHFWVFYVIISLTVLNGAAMVRFLAAFAPDLVAANGMIGESITCNLNLKIRQLHFGNFQTVQKLTSSVTWMIPDSAVY